MTPDHWLEQYYSGEYFSGHFSHLKEVLTKLNIGKNSFKQIITIGGTNGKGETSRCVYEFLSKNESVGLWTSPHLESVSERFTFSKNFQVDDLELTQTFQFLKEWLEDQQTQLSYFEFLFICFMLLASRKNVDFLILEVGLGGRLDAVNTLDADICAITSISRDHQDLLGHRYDLILKEKLGIVRKENTLITNFELSYLRRKTREYKNKGKWIDLFDTAVVNENDNFSKRNQKLAREIIKLCCESKFINNYEFQTRPWRYKLQKDKVDFLFFPSHNPDGIRKLGEFLKSSHHNKLTHVFIAFSKRSETDIDSMIKSIRKLEFKELSLFEFIHEKAIEKNRLLAIGKKYNLEIISDNKFIEKIHLNQKGTVIFTGSNYFLGMAYNSLRCALR